MSSRGRSPRRSSGARAMGRSGQSRSSTGAQPGPLLADPGARRRRGVPADVAGFLGVEVAVVERLRVVAGFLGVFADVDRGVADLDRVADAGADDVPPAAVAGAATVDGAGAVAAADAVDARRRGALVARLRGVVERFRGALARVFAGLPVWRSRIALTSAVSSAISSRTSASRDVRLSRLFFVAFPSLAARHVSSERAAASANSSQSMWRARAAAGVIDGLALERGVAAAVAALVAAALPPVVVLASVMSSPSSVSRPPHSRRSGAAARTGDRRPADGGFRTAHRWPPVDWLQTNRKPRPAMLVPGRRRARTALRLLLGRLRRRARHAGRSRGRGPLPLINP